MNQTIVLNELEVEEVRKLAREKRQSLGFIGDTPISNDILTILDQLNIMLLEYPIESESDRPAFSAGIMYSEEGERELVFIGLNTADYFDKQVFALAHELYHYFTKTGSHLSRLDTDPNTIIEAKANRFAAEFLFPEVVLESIVLGEFKSSTLTKVPIKTLLRFIARLQCTWWLSYRSIVKRLYEIKSISLTQYLKLYEVMERDHDGEYSKIGRAINHEIFSKLNTATNNIGTSPNEIEIIIRNFEDNLIDEDKFADTLNLFNKTPDDFGYEIKVFEADLDEFNDFFDRVADEDEG